MRGVLLFGMLGGMLLSCGNKKGNDSQEQKKDSKVSEKVYKIGLSQIVDHPALNAAKQGFKDALAKAGVKADYDDKIANNDMSNQTLIMQQFAALIRRIWFLQLLLQRHRRLRIKLGMKHQLYLDQLQILRVQGLKESQMLQGQAGQHQLLKI